MRISINGILIPAVLLNPRIKFIFSTDDSLMGRKLAYFTITNNGVSSKHLLKKLLNLKIAWSNRKTKQQVGHQKNQITSHKLVSTLFAFILRKTNLHKS